MLVTTDIQTAERILSVTGFRLNKCYSRMPEKRDLIRNIMVLSDPLTEEERDPFEQVSEALRHDDAGDDAVFSLTMAYREKGTYWARRGEPNIDTLIAFLEQVLKMVDGNGLILQSNESDHELIPDPWIMANELCDLQQASQVMKVFRTLGISLDDRRPLVCTFPDDIMDASIVGKWLMQSGWRNTYIICDERLKIVLCHEKDLHFCSSDHDLIARISDCARAAGLFIAPFDIEQCA